MSDSVQSSNLASLRRQHFDISIVKSARGLLRKIRNDRRNKSDVDLAWLLRHHDVEAIVEDKEFRLRESFDYLLGFYSLLEIACLIEFVPWPLPIELREEALRDLFDRDVRRFYEVHYPLNLPANFRLRLTGDLDLKEKHGPEVVGIFMQFLEFVNVTELDTDLDTFLGFLDYGYWNHRNIEDTLKIIGKPHKLAKRLSKRPSEKDVVDESLHGYLKFLSFCQNLDALLRRSADFPLLQSAMWHYFAYWFDLTRAHVGRQIETGIRNLTRWALRRKGSPATKRDDTRGMQSRAARVDAETSVRAIRTAVKRLLSERYRIVLLRAAAEAQRPANLNVPRRVSGAS